MIEHIAHMDSQLPACDLIDKIFDMEPAHSSEIGGSAWLDRRTGLLFDLSQDYHEGVDNLWRFKVTYPERLPRFFLVVTTFERTKETINSPDRATYLISKKKFLRQFEDRPNFAMVRNMEEIAKSPDFGGIDPKHHDHFVDILNANKRRLAQYPIRDEIIENLGGLERFFEICLKAIKACHCQYIAYPERKPIVREKAKEVRFEIVN